MSINIKMSDKTAQYSLTITEVNLGEVIGKLTSIRALLNDDVSTINGVVSFSAEIPVKKLFPFIEWLSMTTNGTGKIKLSTQ